MASEEMIFNRNLAFLLPWQPIKFRGLDKNNMFGEGLFKEHFCKTLVEISAVRAIKANFHFSHYKSVEALSCHSNESTRATSTRNVTFVEANVMNIYATFQLHPPFVFGGDDFWKIVCKFSFSVATNKNNNINTYLLQNRANIKE